jgi:Uma2 family endonuclease
MVEVLEQLKQSPHLPFYVNELQAILKEEKEKRQSFYHLISEDDKAEFINGEIIMHSPVTLAHSDASDLINRAMGIWAADHNLGIVRHEKMMIECTRNSYEPDICFWRKERASKFKPDQKLFPPPDLIVEISSKSTEATDRGDKFEDYQAHGVKEYWIVDPRHKTIEQYLLKRNKYVLEGKVSKPNAIHSQQLKGMIFPAEAAFSENANLKLIRSWMAGA